ncbi:MAG: hypothetical protein N2690_01825, partial [Rhodocyclaceae bacterium]|nr:hypothetical protein [Rhodocyclaceae bacterium]
EQRGFDMAKAAAKAGQAKVDRGVDAQGDKASARPSAWVEMHGTQERVEAVAPALVQTAIRAFGLVRRIEELEDELKRMKADLARELGDGRSLVVPGVCRVSVAKATSVGIKDADKLRELLGARFDDLVSASVSYKPSEALIEMSADGDDPMSPAYRALLTVRTSTAVRITAEK